MKRSVLGVCIYLLLSLYPALYGVQGDQAGAPPQGQVLQDPDHFKWALPDPFPTTQQWEHRAAQLRRKILLSAGLWPDRERTPLNASIFDIKEGEGFKVAKVYFESFPGFLATGNLYYPTVGKPPYPAILTPHGHWEYGRLQNSETGTIPGRSIDFARQGYVVFSIDMVGYNDSFQLPHDGNKSRAQLVADAPLPYEPRAFRAEWFFPDADLYGFNLGGMQLWNGIRALDFLSSLPEVDPSRIGVTGASGGATQTILLMASDPRVRVAAPVNIIGAEKHPGCGCENLPGLWVDTSTIEVAATFAPRPLLLVSATEDPWTHSTPTRELPWLTKYYALFGAQDRIANVHVNASHNYNAQSRAGVYAFFRKYLNPPGPEISNPASIAPELKSLGDLRVFPDGILPKNAKSGREIAEEWEKTSQQALTRAFPSDPAGLAAFQDSFGEALRLVLSVEKVTPESMSRTPAPSATQGTAGAKSERISRKKDSFALESVRPSGRAKGAVLIAVPESFGRLGTKGGLSAALPWVRDLIEQGNAVFRVRGYISGASHIPDRDWQAMSWPSTYNRSNEILGIQEVMTAIAAIRQELAGVPLTVIGLERAGLLTAFAAAVQGGADRVVADLNGEDPGYDGTMSRLLPVGAIRRVGDLKTVVLLLGGRVHLINPGPGFDLTWYRDQATRAGARVSVHAGAAWTDPGFLGVLTNP
jgi:dienelactone hydrolase